MESIQEQHPERLSGTRKMWQHLWQYGESFIISIGLVIIGFIIEFFTAAGGANMPGFPSNLIILVIFVAYIIFVHRFLQHPLKKWLSSIPAAIAAVSTFTLLILLMGLIPQNQDSQIAVVNQLGLSSLVGSWPYLLSSLNLIIILSFTIVRRIRPFNLRNVAFTLNHLGLWIVLTAASLGAADMVKLDVILYEGRLVTTAYNADKEQVPLNFGIRLHNFIREEYIPNIAIFDATTYDLIRQKEALPEARPGVQGELGNWHIQVLEFYENAFVVDSGYFRSVTDGGAPAAYVRVRSLQGADVNAGWVSSGSYLVPPAMLTLDSARILAMTRPKTKKYASDMAIVYRSGEKKEITVEVNKPVRVNGWMIYQTGYDGRMGKWSKTSYVQLVKDPWLPAVYTGIFMVLAGALYILWMGRKR